MSKTERNWQWQLAVTVVHDGSFGHRIDLEQIWKGRPQAYEKTLGSWKGLGIPEPVLMYARATVDSVLSEHLITRYGVAGELPLKWSGEADPF